MTAEEIAVAALARGEEWSSEFPATRSVLYRRITVRQQQLFVRASEINPDYFGVTQTVVLAAGEADLAVLLDPQAERISQVRIDDVGTSAYVAGQRVNIVAPDDGAFGALAPRATIRDYVLRQYGNDLALVGSCFIDYSKRAEDVDEPDDVPQLPSQFHELLVIDLVKWMVRKSLVIEQPRRDEIINRLTEEENELLGDYDAHIERFQTAEESRFGRTARPIAKPRAES